MDFKDIPKDQWVEIPDEELAKKGRTQWAYVPSNYPGPIAMDATIKPIIKETDSINGEGQIPKIWITKEEAKTIYGLSERNENGMDQR